LLSGGLGIGMGLGAGVQVGQKVGQVMNPQVTQTPLPASDDPKTKLQKLKQMLDEGLITTEDFETKKKQILDSI
jgi:membrane protease subunit (stomatin/prohibitin family)